MIDLDNDDQQLDSFQTETEPIPRGGCLAAFLILSVTLNIAVSLLYLFPYAELKETLSLMPAWTNYVMVLFGFLNAAFVLMVWNWRRAGVYGFAASTLLVFVLNLYAGVELSRALFGFLGIILLAILIRPHWKHMR